MPKLSFQYVRQTIPESLVEFLARRFRYHDAPRWAELVAGGQVKVNGQKVSPNLILETRHKIVYDRPPGPEPQVDATFRVIYEDDDLLAVEKSGNIPTSPSGKYWHHCLVHVLQREMRMESIRAVHRLDRETSGINLFAKNRDAAGRMGKAFQAGAVGKTYTAIVAGHMKVRECYVSAPLGEDHSGTVRIKQTVLAGGRESRTRFDLLALLPGASLLRATPVTGRTHQIRAHAALIGHPVVGDKLYGQTEEKFVGWVSQKIPDISDRQLLHATGLTFSHPTTGERLSLQAPPRILLEIYLKNLPAPSIPLE